MRLEDSDIADLRMLLADIEFGRLEIKIQNGKIVHCEVTTIVNKSLTKRNVCVVSENRKR
ncbi:hypothetical protein TRIP_E160222 [uncultured Spirochaetota bacterium]|uniref:DUF2292 domain-containing protein n=1 Tax=uncultured Spirochaetota bacterium TaxID=460511 RepID=A0A652ZT92_9SPIR|nr:hypothetical protein TRIP_E160222 [uncultured Spirochaetota bacterium]